MKLRNNNSNDCCKGKRISELEEKTQLQGTEYLAYQEGDNNGKLSLDSLKDYLIELVKEYLINNGIIRDDYVQSEPAFKLLATLPELIADRACKDEFGNNINDTYLTRDAVKTYIQSIYEDLFTENPPHIMDGYITVDMLSEAVLQLLNSGGAITNFPDEEDLTVKDGKLKFNDKEYDPNKYSGLGRVMLRRNMVDGVNVLTQEMMSKPNTRYIIQYDFDLRGATVNVPNNCILHFVGGSLNNGTVNGDDTKILNYFEGDAITSGSISWLGVTADEEDITRVKADSPFLPDVLKFKDKEYDPDNFSGLGRVYLRKNISNGKNILTQEMINKANTRYIIQYDYDLDGQTINVPDNCVLEFEGGSLNNGFILNYNKYIQAQSIGLKPNLISEAYNNAQLLANYINMGLKLQLDSTYYFNNSNIILTNDIYLKGGKFITCSSDPIIIAKKDLILEINDIQLDTVMDKTVEAINQVFRINNYQTVSYQVSSISIQNCHIEGCRLFTWYQESLTNNPIDIKDVNIINNYIKNTGTNFIRIIDASIENIIIKDNIIEDCGIGTFYLGVNYSDKSKINRGTLYFTNNRVYNTTIIAQNLQSEYSYITPILTERFNKVFIQNNVFQDIIGNTKNAITYSFYCSDTNLFVSNNIITNVFNAFTGYVNNVMFKCKDATNRYLNNNSYIINKNELIQKYPDTFQNYDFSQLKINFLNIESDNNCGDLIVASNKFVIPGILYCPNVYPSDITLQGKVAYRGNYIEAEGAQGSLLSFNTYDVTKCDGSILIENNIIKHNSINIQEDIYGHFSLFRSLTNGAFKILLLNNTLYNTIFAQDVSSTNKSTLIGRNNNFIQYSRNVITKNSKIIPLSTLINNTFDQSLYKFTLYLSNSNQFTYKNMLYNVRSAGIVELYDYQSFPNQGKIPTLIKVKAFSPQDYEVTITLQPKEDGKIILQTSLLDSIELDINQINSIKIIDYQFDEFTYSLPTIKTEGDGKVLLELGGGNYGLDVLRQNNIYQNYTIPIITSTAKNITDIKQLYPTSYIPGIKVYSTADDLYYTGGKVWRNEDGTLTSKVTII